ncbi:MAG: CBS domain-containing protein [Acidobacteriota bacterium]
MAELRLPMARDFMVSPPAILSPETYLLEAIDRLVEVNVGAAPVVDADGCLRGMLTEKDCLRILSSLTYDAGQDGQVADYLSPVARPCEPSMDIFRVAELFLQNNFPVLPVEENGSLCGVISRAALLRGIQTLRTRLEREHSSFESVAGRQADRPRDIAARQRAAADATPEQLVRLFRRFGAEN